MAKQSLIWTALPNGVTAENELRLSVLLAPRLTTAGPKGKLSEFAPDWIDWPTTLRQAAFMVRLGNNSVTVPVGATTGPNRIDLAHGGADSAAWQALFMPDLPVHSFAYEDLSDRAVVSYDTTTMATLIQITYMDMALKANGDLPTATELVEHPVWKGIRTLLARLAANDRFRDRQTGLRKVESHFDAYIEDRLKSLDVQDRGGAVSTLAAELSRFELFHTPMSPAAPKVKQVRKDDSRIAATWMEHAHKPLPTAAQLVEELDFHQVVAAMNSYPTILRRLGLVVDLIVDRAAFSPSPDALLSVTAEFPPGALSVPTTPAASPRTHARLARRAFDAVPDPQRSATDERIRHGLLDLGHPSHRLLVGDIDGSVMKTMNFARSLGRMESPTDRVDSVSRIERRLGAPSLRTAGLMLVKRQRGAELESTLARNKARNATIEQIHGGQSIAAPDLWAEDLVRGYRFDIWDRTTGVWRSLCQRRASYTLGDDAVTVPADGPETPPITHAGVAALVEEGFVRMAATAPPDPDAGPAVVALHEAVVNWSGWSLAAPPPGRAILSDDTFDSTTAETEAEVPDGLPFRSHFTALPGSLPRLRFGRDYWIRGRAVDLAGNSLPPRPDDFGPEQPSERARPFLRYEPIAPPIIALARPDGGATEEPEEGESMSRVAIRTRNETPADNAVPTTQRARRFAVPPQSTIREAELHGMLDGQGRVDPTLYPMLALERDLDAKHPDAAIVEEMIPMQGPLDPVPVPTAFAVHREGRRLTYLPDPLAETVTVRVLGHPNADPEAAIEIPLMPSGAWPDARPIAIEVYEHPTEAPQFDAAAHTLRVPLPKAVRAFLRLSMRPSEEALNQMAIWRWIAPPPGMSITPEHAAVLTLAKRGRHWMLTPWHTLEVVHATQRPLLDPKILDLRLARAMHGTDVRPEVTATCSIRSTDRVELRAEWHEPHDQPGDSVSATGPIDRDRGDIAFTVKITDPSIYRPRQPIAGDTGGVPEHEIIAEDTIRFGMSKRPPTGERRHEFGDTRYRRIEYWLEATTRFREYMPPSIADDEERLRTVGPRRVTWIESSSPPPVPEVLHVVPTFGWSRTASADGSRTSSRRGGGVRVYLNRPWCASGYGEMLAVVLPPASFNGDPMSVPSGQPYRQFVTQWANDPIWQSANVTTVAPRRSDFPLARTAPDPTGAWLPPSAPPTEADQPPGAFPTAGLTPAGATVFPPGAALEIAPHDVHYDEALQLWYCDIEISAARGYWPFVRLALARYQPIALSGTHLSPVVMADIMPLINDRWLTVSAPTNGRRRTISVYGSSPTASAGAAESGQWGQRRGRPVARPAPRTVFEAWVEQLNPSLGEDLGWSRVQAAPPLPPLGGGGGGVMRPLIPVGGIVAGSARPARRDHTAAGVVSATGSFTAESVAASTNLALLLEAIPPQWRLAPLWTDDVTIPVASDPDARFRIVVAEYEEYLVDDPEIYNPQTPPTAKSRRLVFVEHIPVD